MMKNRLLYGIALVSALLFYVFYYEWTSEIVFFAVLLLPVFSLLVSLPSMLCCRLVLTRRDFTRQDVAAAVSVVAVSGKFFPSGQVRCRVLFRNLTYGGKQVERIRLCNRQKRTLPIATDHCCCVETRVVKPRVYDYLGLIWLPMKKPAPMRTVILPTAEPVTPAPDLAQIPYQSYHAKNGGFAEVHEIRPFRDGDSLRDVHWKLTAKMDDLMLREAMEPDKNLVLVTFRLSPDKQDTDSILGQLTWLSRRLLEAEIGFSVRFFDPETGTVSTVAIGSAEDLQALLSQLLQTPFQAFPSGPVPCLDADAAFALHPHSEVPHEK